VEAGWKRSGSWQLLGCSFDLLDQRAHRSGSRCGGGHGADGVESADRLFSSIHRQECVQRIVREAPHLGPAQPRRSGRQSEVLSDVSGVDQCIAIAAAAVPPGVALEDVGEENRRRSAFDPPRLRHGSHDLLEPRTRADRDQLVLLDRVVVDARRESAHSLGHHIDLAGVQRSGRGCRAQPGRRGRASAPPGDTIGEVEDSGEKAQGNRLCLEAFEATGRRDGFGQLQRGLRAEGGQGQAIEPGIALEGSRATYEPGQSRPYRAQGGVACRVVDREGAFFSPSARGTAGKQRDATSEEAEEVPPIGLQREALPDNP
jgi:hypothetical protein